MFDRHETNPYTRINNSVLDDRRGHSLSLLAAEQSVVLLKNTPNLTTTLPINLSQFHSKKIAVIGPVADDTTVMMGATSDYCARCPLTTMSTTPSDHSLARHVVSLWEGLTSRVGADARLIMNDGSKLPQASKLAQQSDLVIATVVRGSISTSTHCQLTHSLLLVQGGLLGAEARDRTTIGLPDTQAKLIRELIKVASNKLVLVIVSGEPVAIDEFVDRINTIIHPIEGGQEAGTGFASVLFGDVSPSGVLPYTMYPASYVNQVQMSDMQMRPNSTSGTPGRYLLKVSCRTVCLNPG